ncbi:hypothetical protein [Aliarcobacter vitoriensis]|uniref:Flagellin n=1 Tax=Aliarcobacter vitoriensis TaxID=2011099 RepID=A0A366MVM7_9BACT|nr:hypothetical protein [Aliarcobacter vitoriensis]RBQ29923.1 hypothetical protein CRU91_01195 [Aliarcobacter vitoriensis]
MDINAINSANNIQNLNHLNNNSNVSINKAQLKYSVEDFNNVSSENLNVSRSSILKSEFSQDIQSLNDGIAKSQIAQNSMDKLQGFLKNIENKLENSQNVDDKNELKKSINQDLREFNQIAFDTKYKGENLIANRFNDNQESIEVSSNNNIYSIEKPNIANFTNKIFDVVNNGNLDNEQDVQNALNTISNTSNQLEGLSNQFVEFSKQLQSDAKNQIIEQNFNQTINFGRESSDFSKSNINVNAGYLAAAQANIIQEQSVRLLS